jgi:hypothetical protein
MRMPIIPVLLALSLGGCGSNAPQPSGGTAQGEVLPGSASDAMIPLDQVKSQAPLAPKVEGVDKKDAKDPAKAKPGVTAPAAAEPVQEPEAPAKESAGE